MTQEIMKAKTFRHNLKRKWRRSRTHLDPSRDIRQNDDKAKSKYLADQNEFLIGTKLKREFF